VSTAISRSGGESWSVKEVDGVAVGIAHGVFTGKAWWCVVGCLQVEEDVVAGIAAAQ